MIKGFIQLLNCAEDLALDVPEVCATQGTIRIFQGIFASFREHSASFREHSALFREHSTSFKERSASFSKMLHGAFLV
jgi:hypothetical protein